MVLTIPSCFPVLPLCPRAGPRSTSTDQAAAAAATAAAAGGSGEIDFDAVEAGGVAGCVPRPGWRIKTSGRSSSRFSSRFSSCTARYARSDAARIGCCRAIECARDHCPGHATWHACRLGRTRFFFAIPRPQNSVAGYCSFDSAMELNDVTIKDAQVPSKQAHRCYQIHSTTTGCSKQAHHSSHSCRAVVLYQTNIGAVVEHQPSHCTPYQPLCQAQWCGVPPQNKAGLKLTGRLLVDRSVPLPLQLPPLLDDLPAFHLHAHQAAG